MFDAPYKSYKIGETQNSLFILSSNLLKTLHYRFNTEKNEYHVDIKCYKHELYVIEFFLRKDLKSKREEKYGKLTNEKKSSRIVRTCFNIMLELLAKDRLASFAFVGSPTYKENVRTESTIRTKRFILYRYVTINLLGNESFEVFEDEDTSCFLAANKLSDLDLIKQEANIILNSQF